MEHLSNSGRYRFTGARVLVVDDDADIAELFAIWLRGVGHRVYVAGNAGSALTLARALLPNIAVIDIGLPVIDGLELVSMLHGVPNLTACNYIAVTAFQNVDLPARCRAAGFSAFLEKPMPRAALIDAVAVQAKLPRVGKRFASG